MASSGPRYAIYYAPEPGSVLAAFGAGWLGRDAQNGAEAQRPAVPGIDLGRLAEITAEPGRYGFHGTLKAPIRLANGRTAAELEDALAAFAAVESPFETPALTVKALGSFLALVPRAVSPELSRFAAECVTAFDQFRAPPSAAEVEKRRAAGLSDRQAAYLQRWGYPYVFDEFRFHLTLTGRIVDEREKGELLRVLVGLTEPLCRDPFAVRSICLFEQPAESEPFVIRGRYPLGRAG